MAIGVALLFNIKLPINFNSPYKARDIQDFWRRWHITLSRFLRDYIYIPLGGNRKGSFRTYTNLLATFVLGGLWHGAGWTFIFWGFLHGMALAIHRGWQSLGYKLNPVIAWLITFNFVNIAWIFFRAKEWEDAIKVLKGMFGFSGIMLPQLLESKLSFIKVYGIKFGNWSQGIQGDNWTLVWILFYFFVILSFKNSNSIKIEKFNFIFYSSLLVMGIYYIYKPSEFLYFNF